MTTYQHATIQGHKIFYREAGSTTNPTIVLLHGFPSSSHMFRDLIPQLASHFHVVAPDYLGFGYSDAPAATDFQYTFDNITAQIEELLFTTLGLKKFSIYVQDYGAPVGFRIASRHPEAIEGIVVQNGNAYVEGISAAFEPLQPFWANRNEETEKAPRTLLTKQTTIFQYTHGAKNAAAVSPDSYTFDQALLDRPGNDAIQLDLLSQLHLERGALRRVARILPQAPAAHAHRVGAERSFLHRAGSAGVPARPAQSGTAPDRRWPLSAGRAQRARRRQDHRLSRKRAEDGGG